MKKKIDTSHLTLADIERLVTGMADANLESEKYQVGIDAKLKELETELAVVRARYQPALERMTKSRDEFAATFTEKHALVQAWAIEHKIVQFPVKKSIEFLRGIIGFELDKPSVGTLSKWTFTKAVQALKSSRWGKKYLTYKEPSIDKEAILRDREKLKAKGRLPGVGLVIEQDEQFYFTAKRETSAVLKEAA